MGKSFELSPWTTLKGTVSSTQEIIQRRATWVDAESYKDAVIGVEILTHTNCTLSLQTAVAPEGPWTTLASFTGTTQTTKYYTSRETGTDKFDRFIRWKLDRSAANWQTSFKLEVNVL